MEIRQDLFTQSEYAKRVGLTKARINQMIKRGEGNLKLVKVNGTVLIKA